MGSFSSDEQKPLGRPPFPVHPNSLSGKVPARPHRLDAASRQACRATLPTQSVRRWRCSAAASLCVIRRFGEFAVVVVRGE